MAQVLLRLSLQRGASTQRASTDASTYASTETRTDATPSARLARVAPRRPGVGARPLAQARRWHGLEGAGVALSLIGDPDGAGECSANAEALALARVGRIERAIVVLAGAVGQEPFDPVLWHNLGVLLWRAGDASESAACLRRAVRLDGSLARSHLALALVTSSPREALEHTQACTRARLGNTDVPRAYAVLAARVRAWAWLALGLREEAVACLRTATTLAPDDPWPLADLAEVLLLGDEPGAARGIVLRACELAPEAPRLWRLRWEAIVRITQPHASQPSEAQPQPDVLR